MTTKHDLSGVTVAPVLPFHEKDLSIDWDSYERLMAYCMKPSQMVSAFVNGHAGDGAMLSPAERSEVIRRTRPLIGQNTPLMAGIIPYSTEDAKAQAIQAEQAGADVLVLFPMPQFGGGASGEARYAMHYLQSIRAVTKLPLSIFQQDVRAGYGYSTEVLAELVQCEQVIAVKEGSGSIQLYEDNLRMIRARAPHVAMLPSNYNWMFAQAATGADGLLSGMASLVPQELCDLWCATEAGDLQAMRTANDKLYGFVRSVYGAPPLMDMHTRLKVGLAHLGIIDSAIPRPPLRPVPEAHAQRVVAELDKLMPERQAR